MGTPPYEEADRQTEKNENSTFPQLCSQVVTIWKIQDSVDKVQILIKKAVQEYAIFLFVIKEERQ